jgi:nitrite reductase (NADH) large subunit
VIGGGLLGLEAARGIANRGSDTTIVEHSPHLMPRQLDATAAGILARDIEKMGLAVRLNSGVAAIVGQDRVEAIELTSGERIDCDTVVICTGVRANCELARDVGLEVGRGIKVSRHMRTNDPDIYAVGECAEFDENVYGLVGPGFEQAVVAANAIAGRDAAYLGSVPATKLKLIGTDVFSMGDVEQLSQRHDVSRVAYLNEEKGLYRALVLSGWRVVGAIGVGEWDEVNRLQEAIRSRKPAWPWQVLRFRQTGRLWPEAADQPVRNWPRTATVCNCTGVSRGQIGDAIALGAVTIEDVQRDTGASTVCGTCRIHVADLLGTEPPRVAVDWWRWIAGASALSLLLGLLTAMVPVWPTASAIGQVGLADVLWLDGIWKQVSGFTLLGLAVIAALLSVRKRWLPDWCARRLGSFGGWRLVHLATGVATLVALFMHTGFRLGDNLNLWLMTTFLTVCVSGAALGFGTALEHRLLADAASAARLRGAAVWLHVLALWPLPMLLSVHVLSVYFY